MTEPSAHDLTDPAVRRAADGLLRATARAGGRWLVLLAGAVIVVSAAELALPAVLGRAVDRLVGERDAGPWLWWIAGLVLVLVAADVLDDLSAGAAVARSTAWLRHAIVDRLLAAGPRPDGPAAGDVVGRLVANAVEAGRVAPDVVRAAAALLPAAGGIVALALIDPWLCVTFAAGLPFLLLVVRAFTRDATASASRYFAAQGTIASRLVDALAGRRTIAASGTADVEARRILAPLPELHRHGLAVWRAQMRLSTQDAVLLALVEVAVLAVAGLRLADGAITAGQMLAAAEYVFLAASIGGAVTALNRLGRARAAAARVGDVLALPPVAWGATPLPDGAGRVEFRGVCVHRDGRAVLDGIDLVVPARALVAVVGASGAGKSLLAALAGRLADPDAGEVLLDGVPLRELRREDVRRAVAYGFERPVLVGETLADAVALGAGVEERDIVPAARAALADDFVRRLPDGYATPPEDAPMSGGEAQRLGIARAFAQGRRVLVLDDVAASLDTVTEHHIAGVLAGALADRTRIVVAHRASTAARADVVVWLDGGRVRASGTHAELWGDPGYRALFAAGGTSGGEPAVANGRAA